jgi:uncharacterized membrane protein
MENKEYLSEEKYQQNNTKIKKIGKILLIIGIVVLILSFLLTILGFIGFGNSAANSFDTTKSFESTASSIFGSFGLIAVSFFTISIGFILTIAGVTVIFIAHRREITAYTTQQIMPVAQEGIEKMAPTIGSAAGTIAEGITKGIKEGKKDTIDK